ncbi:MAG: hypothetical protein JWO06_4022, partial [Bacteroidota bacterium]|nr:hypothetical protein [Bacteroidota bacterium]
MMVFSQVAVFATTFTATTSGNYSSGTTWGGTAPSFNISTDAVIIPSGFTVTLDGNATFTGALASMQVEGALSSVQGAVLNVGPLATLSGAGAINVSALNLQAGAITTFSGAAVLDSINTSVANLQVVAGLTVSNKVNLAAGTLSVATGGSITMMPGVTINVAAGVLTLNGGTVTLPASYNVVYSTGAITTGLELGGPGLHDITVAVGAGNMLNLSSDLTTSGTLSLVSGDLFIGNHDLTVNGDVAAGGNGAIASSVLSNISVTAAGGLSGTLNFADSTNVNDLTINVGTGNHVTLGGVLNVAGNLTLTSGTFNIGNGSLSINGAVMPGAGYLGGTASSTLSVNSASGIIGPLNFATGAQTVGDFTVNLGFGIQISLVSDLEVKGTLNILNSGGLAINSVTLTVDGDLIG